MKVTTSVLDNLVVGDRIFIIPQRADTYEANPCNRATCIGARALDRTCALNGLGYIKFDANEICFTRRGHRIGLHTPKAALEMLRQFDELAKKYGVEYARANTKLPARLDLEVRFVKPIPPPIDRARKDQINAARNARNAARRERGEKTTRGQPRYVGV